MNDDLGLRFNAWRSGRRVVVANSMPDERGATLEQVWREAAAGQSMPFVVGQARMPGQLVWYGPFRPGSSPLGTPTLRARLCLSLRASHLYAWLLWLAFGLGHHLVALGMRLMALPPAVPRRWRVR